MKAILLLLAWFAFGAKAATLDGLNSPATIPSECHFLGFKREPLTGGDAKHYFAALTEHVRADVLCVGTNLTITSPIITNGGDVIIWASRVRIAAPIDTRPHLNQSQLAYFQNRIFHPGGGYTPSAAEALQWARDEYGDDDRYQRSFQQYYSACIDCRTEKGIAWIPRAPSGLVRGYRYNVGSDPAVEMKVGLSPFDSQINFSVLRSGNVYLIAGEVEIDSSLATPNPAPVEPPCGQVRQYVPFTVDVRGIKGGLGGAGTPSPCPNYTPGTWDCTDYFHEVSGRSGPGGRGADGGSITFVKIGSAWKPAEESALRKVSSAAGGEPGEPRSFWSPVARGNFAATGQFCDFRKRQASIHAPAPGGEAGVIAFRWLDSNAAISFVGQLIQEKDSRFDYELSELARRAVSDQSISALSFDDYFVGRLAAILADSEVLITDAVAEALLRSSRTTSVSVPLQLIGVSPDKLNGKSLSDRSKVFLRQLSDFGGDRPADAMWSYLVASGGLLNIGNSRPFERFQAEALRIDISSQTERLNQLQQELIGIGRILAEIDIREERKERLSELSALAQLLSAAQAEAAANSGLPWAAQLAGALGEAGKAAAATHAAYANSNPVQLVQSAAAFSTAVEKVRALWAAYGSTPDSIAGLRAAMALLQQHYVEFLSRAAETRRYYHDARVRALAAALKSRASNATRLEARHAQFNDLLRVSYASFLGDPSRSKRVLASNLDSVKVFLTQFPNAEPYFQFRDLQLTCPQALRLLKEPGCARVSPSNKSRVLFHSIRGIDGKSFKIPLHVVAPTRYAQELRVFDLQFSIEDLPEPAIVKPRVDAKPDVVFQ